MTVFRIVLAVLSVGVLAATAYVLALVAAQSKDLIFLSVPGPRRIDRIISVAVCVGAFIGAGICVYSGVERVLWWVPRGWGSYTEEGTWIWLSESLAWVAAFLGAFACSSVVGSATARAIDQRNAEALADHEANRGSSRIV